MDQNPVRFLAVFIYHIKMEIIAPARKVRIVNAPVLVRIARIIAVHAIQFVIGRKAAVRSETENGKIEGHTGYVLSQADLIPVILRPVEINGGQGNFNRMMVFAFQHRLININTVGRLEIIFHFRFIIITGGVGDNRLQSVDRVIGFVIGQAVAFQ